MILLESKHPILIKKTKKQNHWLAVLRHATGDECLSTPQMCCRREVGAPRYCSKIRSLMSLGMETLDSPRWLLSRVDGRMLSMARHSARTLLGSHFITCDQWFCFQTSLLSTHSSWDALIPLMFTCYIKLNKGVGDQPDFPAKSNCLQPQLVYTGVLR